MPLAAKIVFTIILGISLVSIFIKNVICADYDENALDEVKMLRFTCNTALSWAWRITLIVFLWAF